MSCGCNSGYDGGVYGGVCDTDTPYPSVSHESVPSLIDNLVNALYGAITKDVSSGKVVWNIPCDPANIPATINNIPRNAGEGLLCYIIRALNLTGESGIVTVNGTQTLTNKTLTAPIINGGTINNLTATGTLTLPNGSISNIDVASNAAIATSKLASLTATGSTTARTLENRFANVVNILDFLDPNRTNNGTFDDTHALQAAADRATAIGDGAIYIPRGLVLLIDSGDIVLTRGVSIFSDTFQGGTYEEGTQTKIILNPDYTIRVTDIGCSIKGLFIRRKGLYRATTPSEAIQVADSMYGTAITVFSYNAREDWNAIYERIGNTVTVTSQNHGLTSTSKIVVFYDTTDQGLATNGNSISITYIDANTFSFTTTSTGTAVGTIHWARQASTDDLYIGHCFIAGFNQAINISFAGRYLLEHIYGDNRNGIWTRQCSDVGRIQNCHFWPWYTVGVTGGTNRRQGIGYFIDDVNDGSIVSNCFSSNYDVGFKISGSTVSLIGCKTDGAIANLASDSKGFWITYGLTRNATYAVELTGCGSCSHQYSYYFDSKNPTVYHSMVNCSAWSQAKNHIKVVNGILYATACNFYNTTTDSAISVDSTATSVRVASCTFQNVGTVYSINSSSTYKVSITPDNAYFGTCNGLDEYTSKIVTSGTVPANRHSFYQIGGGGGPMTYYYKATGTPDNPLVAPNGTTLGGITAGGHDGTNFIRSGVLRFGSTSNAISNGVLPTNCIISTTNASGILADRIVVDIDGNLVPASNNVYTLGSSSSGWDAINVAYGSTASQTVSYTSGSVAPETNVSANVGSLYTNNSGTSGQTLYVKETGTGNTGWSQAVTAGLLTTTSATLASGSAVSLVTATAKNVTSISLAAGTWDVNGVVDFVLTGTTSVFGASNYIAGISTTTNTLGGQDTYHNRPFIITLLSGTMNSTTPKQRLTLATTTTVYLIAQATFSAGSVSAYGTITANRVF